MEENKGRGNDVVADTNFDINTKIEEQLKKAKEKTIGKWIEVLKRNGFSSDEIVSNLTKEFLLNFEKHILHADLAVKTNNFNYLIVKVEPLNRPIISIERRTISIARIINKTPFHYALLTNSRDELLIDVKSGKSKKEFRILTKEEFLKTENLEYRISDQQADKEKRIFATFDSLKCDSCNLD